METRKSGNCAKCGIWRQVLCRDHIVPRRDGGSNDQSNIQLICANCHQDKTAAEQSAAHKGRPKSPEQLAKMRAWQLGVPKKQATKDKIRKALTGRIVPPDVRAKISAAHMGRIVSSETVAKISAALKGRRRRGQNCPHGHPYDEENSIIEKNGVIRCRACLNARKRAQRATESEAARIERLAARAKKRLENPETTRARDRAENALRKEYFCLRYQKLKLDMMLPVTISVSESDK